MSSIWKPTEDERKFVGKTMDDLVLCSKLRSQSFVHLGDRNIVAFWQDSSKDYNSYVQDTSGDDGIRPYSSGITRSKVNKFISNLASKIIVPQVAAQNAAQETDEVISRVGGDVLAWAEENDGRPDSSGLKKLVETIHNCCVEGTVHVQENWTSEQAEKEVVPNEQIFVPNFWQPYIQKQPFLMRLQNDVSFEEAEEEFGDLPKFEFVAAGSPSSVVSSGEKNIFKDYDVGISTKEGRVSILRVWRPVPRKNKTKKEPEKYFNILVNGIPLFDPEEKMPFAHGRYPIYKTEFEWFTTKFYWGNSLPNKIRHEKAYLDGMKTLLRYKSKLHLLPPLFVPHGLHITRDALLPSRITSIAGNVDSIKKLQGVAEPINQSDVQAVTMAEREIEADTISPTSGGQTDSTRRTAREVLLQDARAQELFGLFGLMITFLVEAGGWLRIRNLFQFLPRKKIEGLSKISIPNRTLGNGETGTLEVLFEKPPEMNEREKMAFSSEILRREKAGALRGKAKEIVYIDPAYLKELNLFVTIKANPASRKSEEMEKVIDQDTYALLKKDPVIIQNPSSSEAVTRTLLRSIGGHWDEMRILPKGGKTPAPAPALAPAGAPTRNEFLGGMRSSTQPERTESPISLESMNQ